MNLGHNIRLTINYSKTTSIGVYRRLNACFHVYTQLYSQSFGTSFIFVIQHANTRHTKPHPLLTFRTSNTENTCYY
jgi:hypothetical protein